VSEATFRDGFPCWVDLAVRDVDAALAFYSNVMGWTPGERSGPEFGGYAMWFRDDVPAAGVGPIDGDSPASWTVYLATHDMDASLQTVADAGGRALSPVMSIGPLGRMAVVADPADAVFGLWEAADFAGFARISEPGFLDWCDVQSTDVAASRDFLTRLFGYHESVPDPAPPMESYRQLDIAGTPAIGTMAAFAAPVSFWMAYFEVTNADAACGAASAGGGSVLHGPEDTPFGRLATIADPEGAVFSVIAR
jgi:uncharacterized protein